MASDLLNPGIVQEKLQSKDFKLIPKHGASDVWLNMGQ